MANESNFIDEDKIPENLQPVEAAAQIPGRVPAAPNPHDMPQFFSGSMPPSLQHDVAFVGTEVGTPRIPKYSLMPFGNQSNPFTNAAAQSAVVQTTPVQPSSATVVDTESIASNVQSGISYTAQDSDRDTLISMTNNAGGTVILPGPPATPTFVQFLDFSGAAHTVNGVLTNGAGNLMYLSLWNGATTAFTVSDSNGNTWILIDTLLDGGGNRTSNYYAENIKGGSNTITVSFTGGGALLNAVVMEYSGLQSSASLDVHAFTLAASGITITTTALNDLVVFSSPHCDTETVAAPWTGRYNDPDTFAGFQLGQDRLVPAAGTTINTLGATTPGIPNDFTQFIVAFRANNSINTFSAGWYTYIENVGNGTFNVTSTALIDGVLQTIPLAQNQGILVVYDGTNYYTERGIGIPIPVSVPNGGTGRSTLTNHAVLLGAGTSPVNFAAPGTAGFVLKSRGVSTDPDFEIDFYSTVQAGGVSKPQEPRLNFLSPFTVTDNPGNTSTDIGTSGVLTAVVDINGAGTATDKQFYMNGVTDGAAVWAVKINGVADGG